MEAVPRFWQLAPFLFFGQIQPLLQTSVRIRLFPVHVVFL